MLVGNYIILVLRVDGLVFRLHVDLVLGEAVGDKVGEELGVAGAVEVDVGMMCVLVLFIVEYSVSALRERQQRSHVPGS